MSTIIKSQNAAMKSYESTEPNTKRSKSFNYDAVDEPVLKLIKRVRDHKLSISDPLIKNKALNYAKHFGCNKFQASSEWLEKFRKGIASRKRLLIISRKK